MPRNSYFYGQWDANGILSKFELQYEANFELNQDGTFRSSGKLDGENIINSGTYEIDTKNNNSVLLPLDS